MISKMEQQGQNKPRLYLSNVSASASYGDIRETLKRIGLHCWKISLCTTGPKGGKGASSGRPMHQSAFVTLESVAWCKNIDIF